MGETILDTYDCYSPKHQYTYDVYEVFEWFKEAGLHKIEIKPRMFILGYKKCVELQESLMPSSKMKLILKTDTNAQWH